GSPAASTASPRPRPRRCNTPAHRTTLRDSPTFTPMARFRTAGLTDTVGGRLVWGWAGRHSRMGNGSWILHLAGPGPAISRGAGLPITMEDGSLMPPVAVGSIRPPFFTYHPFGR